MLQREQPTNVHCFVNSKCEVFATDDEKRGVMFDHFDNAFTDIESVMDLVPEWLDRRWIFAAMDMPQRWMLCFYETLHYNSAKDNLLRQTVLLSKCSLHAMI